MGLSLSDLLPSEEIDYYYCHRCLKHFKPKELRDGMSPCCSSWYGVSHWTLELYEVVIDEETAKKLGLDVWVSPTHQACKRLLKDGKVVGYIDALTGEYKVYVKPK